MGDSHCALPIGFLLVSVTQGKLAVPVLYVHVTVLTPRKTSVMNDSFSFFS